MCGLWFEFADEEIEQPPLRVEDRLRIGFEINDRDGGTVRIRLMRAAVHVGRPEGESLAENKLRVRSAGVTSRKNNTVSLIDPFSREQTAIKVGSQPMDTAFRGDELFVACQGDGSVHVIDIQYHRAKMSFQAGYGMRVARVFLIVPPEATAETSPLPGAVPRTFPPLSSACTVH
jgi:hypothetical protein